MTIAMCVRVHLIGCRCACLQLRAGAPAHSHFQHAIQCKIIFVVSISWLYHCNIHYKDVVKHSNVRQHSVVLLVLSPCVLFLKYLHVADLDFDIDLEDLASASAYGLVEYHWFISLILKTATVIPTC